MFELEISLYNLIYSYFGISFSIKIHEVAEGTNRLALFCVEYDEGDEIDSDFPYNSKSYYLTVCMPFWIQSAEHSSEC